MTEPSTPAAPGEAGPGDAGASDAAVAASTEPAQVQVVRGEPDDVELAALVAGLVAVSGSSSDDDDDAGPRASAWSDRGRAMRSMTAPPPGPDTWRWSLHQ